MEALGSLRGCAIAYLVPGDSHQHHKSAVWLVASAADVPAGAPWSAIAAAQVDLDQCERVELGDRAALPIVRSLLVHRRGRAYFSLLILNARDPKAGLGGATTALRLIDEALRRELVEPVNGTVLRSRVLGQEAYSVRRDRRRALEFAQQPLDAARKARIEAAGLRVRFLRLALHVLGIALSRVARYSDVENQRERFYEEAAGMFNALISVSRGDHLVANRQLALKRLDEPYHHLLVDPSEAVATNAPVDDDDEYDNDDYDDDDDGDEGEHPGNRVAAPANGPSVGRLRAALEGLHLGDSRVIFQ